MNSQAQIHQVQQQHQKQREWQPEHSLSVPDAIKEAMDENTPPNGDVKVLSPEPHLPLRKTSAAQRMKSRAGSIPKPIFAPSQLQFQHHNHHPHQLRGFNPSPVQPVPHITNLQASSEHAFAGREPRRPFQPAMGVLENQQSVLPYEHNSRSPPSSGFPGPFRTPSSPMTSPTVPHELSPAKRSKSLKHSKSMGDGLRNIRNRMSGRSRRSEKQGRPTPDSVQSLVRPTTDDEARDSFRSALTSHSSFGHASSVLTTHTTHTSLSSNSEYVKIRREDYDEGGLTDVDMSVDDVLGMYENGFESGPGSARPSPRPSMQSVKRPSFDLKSVRSMPRSADVAITKNSLDVRSRRSLDRPTSAQNDTLLKRPNAAHRRSQSASILIRASIRAPSPSPAKEPPVAERNTQHSEDFFTGKLAQPPKPTAPSAPVPPGTVPRDRYGFKKASHHVTVEQYDAWDAHYSQYLERRKVKWDALMKQFGYETNPAQRFPAKSEKVKRYVRKGIPPEYRGAAWFWYAGGPKQQAKEPELYNELKKRVANGELTDNDREHIERDLHRTFPDNIKFKPDPATMHDVQAGAGGGSATDNGILNNTETAPDGSPESKKSPDRKKHRHTREPETPMLQSLRNVLQTFAVHKPAIGYCQSLNFIAGLLLLFLNGDEHKAFILLNIVTDTHLPGTHGTTLEGANIDIGVLMSCIRDSLPGIWHKLDDKKDTLAIGAATTVAGGVGGLRLPTVSLATTAWFMSLFVGTLPIETVLRVWDCLFIEGSKTLFRMAMAIFKAGESQILKVSDPMEIFQVVQTIPRSMLDCNALLEVCFRRRGGFGSVSQGMIEKRRTERRMIVKEGRGNAGLDDGNAFRRMKSRMKRVGTARIST